MLSQNFVIHLYQYILKILNRYPTKDIAKDRINVFIDFKYSNSNLFLPSALGSESYRGYFFYQLKNTQLFWYLLRATSLDSHNVFLWFRNLSLKSLENFLETLKLISSSVSNQL